MSSGTPDLTLPKRTTIRGLRHDHETTDNYVAVYTLVDLYGMREDEIIADLDYGFEGVNNFERVGREVWLSLAEESDFTGRSLQAVFDYHVKKVATVKDYRCPDCFVVIWNPHFKDKGVVVVCLDEREPGRVRVRVGCLGLRALFVGLRRLIVVEDGWWLCKALDRWRGTGRPPTWDDGRTETDESDTDDEAAHALPPGAQEGQQAGNAAEVQVITNGHPAGSGQGKGPVEIILNVKGQQQQSASADSPSVVIRVNTLGQ